MSSNHSHPFQGADPPTAGLFLRALRTGGHGGHSAAAGARLAGLLRGVHAAWNGGRCSIYID